MNYCGPLGLKREADEPADRTASLTHRASSKYIQPGEELVIEPFGRLIQQKQLAAYEYDGFFAAMDTFKDKQQLDDLYEGGEPPWVVWGNKNNESEKLAPA